MAETIYVIGYARVSTPKQAQTGESLENQEEQIRRFCKKKGYTLFPQDKVFREPYTGSTVFRPVYREILELIKQQTKSKQRIKYLIFWDFDRLTRGGTVDYDQIWKDVSEYGVELRDTTEIIQEEVDLMDEFGFDFSYSWAKGRISEEAERSKAEDARKLKKKILQTLILPEIRLTLDGYHVGRPDYGFRNKKIFVENKKKCIQERFEAEAIYIERMYRLRAENVLSDQEICDDINSIGYKSQTQNQWSKDKTRIIGQRGGNILTPKQLPEMIKRFTYCGVICEKWTRYQPIKAKFNGLVSIDTWNKANRGRFFLEENEGGSLSLTEDVSIHGKKRKKYNPNFPFKGVLMCEVCGKPMKASATPGKSKKRFGAYHCERNHKRNAFKQKEVEMAYRYFISNIRFTDKFLKIFEKSIFLQFRRKEGELSEYTAKANTNVAEFEIEKTALIKSFTVAVSDEMRKGVEEQLIKVQRQIDQAKNYRNKMELKEMDVTNFIQWCKNIMEHPEKIVEDIRSEQELLHIYSLFFVDLPTYTQIVSGTPKLSLVFKLSEDFKVNKSVLVALRGIEPRLTD